MSKVRAAQLESLMASPLSLDAEMRVGASDTGRPRTLGEHLEDPNAPSPFADIDDLRLQRVTRASLQDLTERERRIVCWRFGLDGQGEHTLQQIATRLGLSRERVRQLEARALGKLREGREGAQLRALADDAE